MKKQCPFCAEEIQDAAIVCKHCNRDLPVAVKAEALPSTPPAPTVTLRERVTIWTGLGLIAIVAAAIGFLVGGDMNGFAVILAWFGFTQFVPSRSRIVRVGGGLLLMLVMVGLLADTGSPTPVSDREPRARASTAPPPAPRAEPAPPTEPLELISTRGYNEHGYHMVEGEVKNLSRSPMANVQVVATWYDDKGTLITSDDALVEFNPVMPGQTTPFKTMSRSNPLMSKYRVTFKEFFGAAIPTKDSRK